MPPTVTEGLAKIRTAESCPAIQQQISKVVAETKRSDVPVNELANAICGSLAAAWSSEVEWPGLTFGGEFWRFVIRNTGDQPAKSVVLDTPFDGVARVSDPPAVTRNPQRIEIAEIRHGATVTVDIWTSRSFTLLGAERPRITHAAGFGKIRESTTVAGWQAWAVTSGVALAAVAGGVVATWLLGLVAYNIGRRVDKWKRDDAPAGH